MQIYDNLNDASQDDGETISNECRLERLTELRRLIGARAYLHGWLPVIPGD